MFISGFLTETKASWCQSKVLRAISDQNMTDEVMAIMFIFITKISEVQLQHDPT